MRQLATMPFTTDSGNCYVYDDNTSMVFPATPSLEPLLEAHANVPMGEVVAGLSGQFDETELRRTAAFIAKWERQFGAFYRTSEPPAGFRAHTQLPATGDVRALVDSVGTRQIVLHLTEDCNLRCRYCYYSEVYPLTRNRAARIMLPETGRRAIDLFVERVNRTLTRYPHRAFAVSFYGGEPLLAHDLLRHLVVYAERRAPRPPVFAVTTNGTLLHGGIVDFLVEHNFEILVSLDGDRPNHDRNRPHADGAGSYDRIAANLHAFRERHPGYAKVRLITTMDPRTDLDRLQCFIDHDGLHLPPIQRLSSVSVEDTAYYDAFSMDEKRAFAAKVAEFEQQYFDAESTGATPPRVARLLCETPVTSLLRRRRPGNPTSGLLPFTATCVPGLKLAVRVDGTLDICERVNGTLPIGSVDAGIDYDAIARIVGDYNQACVGCWTCPATRICGCCMVTLNANRCFRPRDSICERVRTSSVRQLSRMYSAWERRPEAFRHLEGELRQHVLPGTAWQLPAPAPSVAEASGEVDASDFGQDDGDTGSSQLVRNERRAT